MKQTVLDIWFKKNEENKVTFVCYTENGRIDKCRAFYTDAGASYMRNIG